MTRREVPLDPARIAASLAQHDVDYVLIGGLAVQAHGHVRTTQDVDLIPAPGADNRARLAAALEALGARPAGTRGQAAAPFDVRAALERVQPVALDTDAGGVDVHPAPPGAARYDELRARALVITIAGVEIAVAGLDDLIAMKRAARRPIDIGDIAALTAGEAP